MDPWTRKKAIEIHKNALIKHVERADAHEDAALGYLDEGNVVAALGEARCAREETLKAIERCTSVMAELQNDEEATERTNKTPEAGPDTRQPTQDPDPHTH